MQQLLDSIPTTISVPGASIAVTHHASVALGEAPQAIVLREPDVTPDTLTQIDTWPAGRERRTVLLLWNRQSVARGMALHYNETTNTLFVGAETFATAVSLDSGEAVGAHAVALFWSFQPAGEFVIELGELSCFLRSGTGEILGETSVDPPYELTEETEGIRFDSPVMGTTWLRFPRAG